MIIFGWGKTRTRDYGPVYPVECQNCFNPTYYQLVKSKTYFSIFFVPLIPYRTENWMLCPICGMGYELNDRKAKKAAKELAEYTEKFEAGEMSEFEYQDALTQFEREWLGEASREAPAMEEQSFEEK